LQGIFFKAFFQGIEGGDFRTPPPLLEVIDAVCFRRVEDLR